MYVTCVSKRVVAIIVPRLELLFLSLRSIFAGNVRSLFLLELQEKVRGYSYGVRIVETGRVFPFKYEKNSKIQIFINLSDHNLN